MTQLQLLMYIKNSRKNSSDVIEALRYIASGRIGADDDDDDVGASVDDDEISRQLTVTCLFESCLRSCRSRSARNSANSDQPE